MEVGSEGDLMKLWKVWVAAIGCVWFSAFTMLLVLLFIDLITKNASLSTGILLGCCLYFGFGLGDIVNKMKGGIHDGDH